MNRSILALAILLAVVAPATAWAQSPTPAQIEKAKKAFAEGKQFFDKGDFPEAVLKFKESYTLSKNPVLLYNIGFANESAGMDDIALFYYRKFLTDAPEDAAQRGEVLERVKVLEKKFQGGGTTVTTPEPVKPPTPVKAEPLTIKPVGTYSETDFQHESVFTAPPKKPLDVTAYVPEDSGFVVTLHYRTAGEGKFTSKPMRWRYKELVGRIPAPKMLGDSVQYYIEVKDTAGTVVTRSGKSTSPNLITIEAGAAERFYPDFSEDGEVQTAAETRAQDLEEDPLNKNKQVAPDPDEFAIRLPDGPGGNGFRDVGSSKFTYMKWGSTAATVTLFTLSAVFYVSAGNQAGALEDDSTACGVPPCRTYDPYDQDLEAAGKRNQTLSRVTLGIGLGTAAIAGYYWYKDKVASKGRVNVAGKSGSPESSSWSVAPAIGEGFAGAAAAARF